MQPSSSGLKRPYEVRGFSLATLTRYLISLQVVVSQDRTDPLVGTPVALLKPGSGHTDAELREAMPMEERLILRRPLSELERAAASGKGYYSCEQFEDVYGRLVVGVGMRLTGTRAATPGNVRTGCLLRESRRPRGRSGIPCSPAPGCAQRGRCEEEGVEGTGKTRSPQGERRGRAVPDAGHDRQGDARGIPHLPGRGPRDRRPSPAVDGPWHTGSRWRTTRDG